MTKLPPMPVRDRGGVFALNNPDDGSPIREMFNLGEALLLITDKCTYRMQVADQIDPTRSNPSLSHNVQQRLFDHGVQSELLRDTLLLAKIMFRNECLPQIDNEVARQLAFEALCEIVSMQDAAEGFAAAEKQAVDKAQRSPSKDNSLVIPAVGNVKTHCKTFIQKADHFAVALLKIVRMFHPAIKQMDWDDFRSAVTAQFGAADNFTKVADLTVPLLLLVRNARNSLEHHNQGVTITDFHLQADGSVVPPSIEIDYRGSKHDKCPVGWFMTETAKALRNAFEMTVVHSAAKAAKPFAGLPITVGVLDADYQRAWGVRFAYGTYDAHGRFVPMG